MKIKHKYEKFGDDKHYECLWSITITYNDKIYKAEISYTYLKYFNGKSDVYWYGEIKSEECDEDGNETLYINFSDRDIYKNLSCILIGIKEIINGDFSNVVSSDFYHSNINNVISNKNKILNKISHEILFDRVMDNKRKELCNLPKEELLKYL